MPCSCVIDPFFYSTRNVEFSGGKQYTVTIETSYQYTYSSSVLIIILNLLFFEQLFATSAKQTNKINTQQKINYTNSTQIIMDEPVVQFKNWVRYHSIFTISYMLTSVFLFLSVFFRYLDSTQFLISSKDNLLQSFWKVWPTVAFPGQVIDLNLLEIPKAQAIHFIVKYWAYMTIVYQYNIVRNAETEMFLDPFRRQSKGHFYWFIILTFIILTALYILGIYDFSMESLMSILLFSWYKDRPNARTDIFFAFPVTRKQYTIGIVILRLLIIGQNYNMQVPIWKLVFSGFIFQYYVLPFAFVMFYSFVRNFIATKYQIDLFKPPKILQLLKINSVFVFFKKNNEEKKQDRMQTIDKLNFNTT